MWKTSQLLKVLGKHGQRSLKSLSIGNHCQKLSTQDMVRSAMTPATIILSSIGGPAIPVNVMLFEEVTKNLIRFLSLFQTDQPMALFITETNFPVRFFMEKCILKSALSKVHSSISVAEIDLNEVTR